MTDQELCDQIIAEKLQQLAGVVERQYLGAVAGAREWGHKHRADLVAKCSGDVEDRLAELRCNGLVAEFKEAVIGFFRAELELYKAHAEWLAREAG